MDILLRLVVMIALAAPIAAGGYILRLQRKRGWRRIVFIGVPSVLLGFVPWFLVMITGSDYINFAVIPVAWLLGDLSDMYIERRQRRH